MRDHLTKCKRAAAALRAWREREGLSITTAAERLELNTQNWSDYEHVKKRPSLANALLIDQLTLGAVRFEWWDYSNRIMATVAHIAKLRAAEHAAGVR